jgi:hypothetical protein
MPRLLKVSEDSKADVAADALMLANPRPIAKAVVTAFFAWCFIVKIFIKYLQWVRKNMQ